MGCFKKLEYLCTMKQLLSIFLLLVALCCCTTEADRNRMRSGLDSINALNRNDQPFTVKDVEPYVQFFDNEGTPNDRLLAHYLLGRAYYEAGEAPMALECYQKAAECADTTSNDCDYAQLCRVYGQMAEVFYHQGLYREQLEHINMSVRYAWKGKDTLAALMSYEQESFAYQKLGLNDSAIIVAENVARLYDKFGYPGDAAITLGTIVRTLLSLGIYSKAKDYMNRYESESGFFDSLGNIEKGREIYYKAKGLYYLYNNRYDSAEYYFRKELRDSKDFNNQNAAAMGLALLYQKTHKTDSAAKYAIYAYAMNDSMYAQKTTKTVERMQAMYDYSRHQEIAKQEKEKADKERKEKENLTLIFVFSAIAALLVILKIYADKKRSQRLYRKNIEQLEQSQTELLQLREYADEYLRLLTENEEKNAEIQQLHTYAAKLDTLIAEKETVIATQRAAIEEQQKNMLKDHAAIDDLISTSDIYQTLLIKQHQYKLTKKELHESRKLVIEHMPELNSLLLTQKYKINETDFNACMLFRFGFRSKEVSTLLNLSQARISQICSKVLKRVFDTEEGGAAELINRLYKFY